MQAIDTNVIARFLLNDDPAQSPIAASTIAEGALIPHSVILELGWLLSSRYCQPRHTVAEVLINLIDIPAVEVIDAISIKWAIGRYSQGADLADMIHIVGARDADSFVSFEKRLAKLAGLDAPLPIRTLA